MIFLRFYCLLQNCECFHLAGAQTAGIKTSQTLAHKELFQPRFAIRGDERLGARKHGHVFARPDGRTRGGGLETVRIEESAPAFLFQTGFPARVALPTGLVGELKMKGDDQFFLSAEVRPAADRTASAASRQRSSGPAAASDSGVAGAPSISRPETSRNPQRR